MKTCKATGTYSRAINYGVADGVVQFARALEAE